jgi:D-alanyl-D-alanine carboxypeptidase
MTQTFRHCVFPDNLIRKLRGGFVRFIMALAVAALIIPGAAEAATKSSSKPKGNPRYAAIIMDADTGLILDQSNANKSLHPASLTKMMTLLMTFEAIEAGKLNLKERIPVSSRAANQVPSKLGLSAGSSIKVEDAIYGLVTKSANDVAVTLAEKIGGTESNFAKMMTERARALGMGSTTFKNASGLHNPGQVSTARDMAKLARTIIKDYPEYYTYFSKKNFTYNGVTHRNHNRLMSSYPGMDGMKTGYIGPSGFNLVASAVRNDHRLIGVVFGGRTAKTRDAHMAKLLDRAFARVGEVHIASATPQNAPIPPRKPEMLLALASLNNVDPAGGIEQEQAKWASLKSGKFSELIGEGDYDPAVSKRIETGLMAIAALKGEEMTEDAPMKIASAAPLPTTGFKNSIQQAAHTPRVNSTWSIQIGAFASRAKTDQAIQQTLSSLPNELADASPIIVPLRTDAGLLYRGRLSGYNRDEAIRACTYLQDCLPVPPQN